ncbi:unnamed protein product [Mytilus edulis]|uniref:Uncharacterized protein n=1 Tax=Mytilus edulis TaxID=6550 RepID=A0A8S3SUN6_MYTED|nr:unnamed protein product [Mytilus edulis]
MRGKVLKTVLVYKLINRHVLLDNHVVKNTFRGSKFFLNGKYGKSDELPWIDNIICSGSESDLQACSYSWTTTSCDGYSNVGLFCEPTPVKLVNGAGLWEGRIEIFKNGHWGSVCDSSFSTKEALVICRMLGFKELENIIRLAGGSHPMEGRVEILHNSEWSAVCDVDWDDVEANLVLTEQVKLIGSTPGEGTVLINIDGFWGTLCDQGFNKDAANVICRELGYWSSSSTPYSNAWFGQGNGTSHDLKPQCFGNETQISFCPLDLTTIRLVNGDQPGRGRLEIMYNGHWGSFCWKHWTMFNTQVVCRMLKYSHTQGRSSSVPKHNSAILIGAVKCNGNETNIGLCKAYFEKETCGRGCCNIKAKLSEGLNMFDGRVDIFNGKHWGSLCDNTISPSDARVLCSTATGYKETQPYLYHLPNPEFHTNSFNELERLSCNGWEEHIAQCSFGTTASCGHHFTHLNCFHGCFHTFTITTGDLKSQNYPQFYQPNMDCMYEIIPPKGVYKIKFDDLQMADKDDYVEVSERIVRNCLL